jgi:hypothetical protein
MSRSCGHRHEKCCGCDFSNILLLILIALQFSGRDGIFGREICSGEEHHREHGIIDNSILFILAFYYLVCCREC